MVVYMYVINGYTVVHSIIGGQYSQDNCSWCDAAAASAKECDGVHSSRQTSQPLLHLHTEHHPGGGGPNTGPQVTAENKGEEAGPVYTVGTC